MSRIKRSKKPMTEREVAEFMSGSRNVIESGRSGIDDSKNWKKSCCACGARPTVGATELCGPCCFGEAKTAGGRW